jgi:enoyl-CoA hydratase/carnithine racemase
MYEQIRYEVEDPIATLTLNRPGRLNAWTQQMGREIKHALAAAEKDRRVVAIIMTGEGRGFCAGADLTGLGALSQGGAFSSESGGTLDAEPGDPSFGPSFRGTLSYPMSIPKPIIAAINGPCIGMALPMVLACDVRFASDRATFSTAFAKRGLIAEWGLSWILPRVVGLGNAVDLLLSARQVEAAEALRIGLVNRVVPHDELLQAARSYALEIARNCSPSSLAVIKREVLQHQMRTFAEAEEDAMKCMLESFSRDDFREGVSSFLEKRPPKFGRLGLEDFEGARTERATSA